MTNFEQFKLNLKLEDVAKYSSDLSACFNCVIRNTNYCHKDTSCYESVMNWGRDEICDKTHSIDP